ncbi:MAG: TIGR04255 family protein, partial [Cyanobacteria bacterium J06554_3]
MSFSSSFTIDIADSFPRLPKAPIIEAMIYWKAPIGDTPTLPELTDELTRRLPNYPIVRSQQNISISASFSADGTSEIDHTAQPGLRLEDKNRHIAQVTPNSITLSRLEPYNRWEAFKAEALDFWDIFAELRKPDELQQVGVRYINRIPLNVG